MYLHIEEELLAESKVDRVYLHPEREQLTIELGDNYIDFTFKEMRSLYLPLQARDLLLAIGINKKEIDVWLEDSNVDGLQGLSLGQVVQDFFFRRLKCQENNWDPLDNWC